MDYLEESKNKYVKWIKQVKEKSFHLDRHAVGVGTKGRGRRAGVGNCVGAGFTDEDLRCWDMKLSTRHLTANKPWAQIIFF